MEFYVNKENNIVRDSITFIIHKDLIEKFCNTGTLIIQSYDKRYIALIRDVIYRNDGEAQELKLLTNENLYIESFEVWADDILISDDFWATLNPLGERLYKLNRREELKSVFHYFLPHQFFNTYLKIKLNCINLNYARRRMMKE